MDLSRINPYILLPLLPVVNLSLSSHALLSTLSFISSNWRNPVWHHHKCWVVSFLLCSSTSHLPVCYYEGTSYVVALSLSLCTSHFDNRVADWYLSLECQDKWPSFFCRAIGFLLLCVVLQLFWFEATGNRRKEKNLLNCIFFLYCFFFFLFFSFDWIKRNEIK